MRKIIITITVIALIASILSTGILVVLQTQTTPSSDTTTQVQ